MISIDGKSALSLLLILGLTGGLLWGNPSAARTSPTPAPAAEPPTEEANGAFQAEVEHSEQQVQDEVITSLVETRLMGDPEVDAARLRVQTEEGNVTLHGQVPNEDVAARAVELAEQVEGVESVSLREGPVRGMAPQPPVDNDS